MQKIAILGGTFDPIHNGHLQTATYFARTLKLDKIFFIPTNIPPHKMLSSSTSAEDRLEMCKLAVKNNPLFEVSDIEILREGKSYTIDTLKYFHQQYPDDMIYLIMGADMFLTIMEWKNPLEIFKLATICTVPRNDSDYKILESHAKKLSLYGLRSIVMDAPLVSISSTEIRDRIKNKQDVSDMVPPELCKYILRNKLYQR